MRCDGIDCIGEFKVERVPSLPSWSSSYEGRMVYTEDNDRLYIGIVSGWRLLAKTTDDVDLSATASEINTACDGISATASEINTACDGISATASEINTACDGISATAAKINDKCNSEAFVNNANGNPNISDTVLIVDTAVAENTWESVGFTGSGKDNTWTALNSVPSNVDWIEVKTYISATNGSASMSVQCHVYARKDGGSETASTDNRINSVADRTDGSGNGHSTGVAIVKIPVSSRAFDIRWSSDFTSNGIGLILTGYGYNP